MKEQLNTFNLIRAWYNFKFENPSKVKAKHSDMYFYIVDLCNRLGGKKEFGLPTYVTMEALQIGSYNTYKITLKELIEFGFIISVKDSVNQHQSKIVALSIFDKALDTSLDKSHIKALDKSPDSINKQETKNKEQINNTIDFLYNLYPSKCVIKKNSTGKSSNDKIKIKSLLKNISKEDLKITIEKYVLDCKENKVFMKNFKTFLNNLPDYSEEENKEIKNDSLIYYRWENDGASVRRSVDKVEAKAYFESQLLGGYKSIILR